MKTIVISHKKDKPKFRCIVGKVIEPPIVSILYPEEIKFENITDAVMIFWACSKSGYFRVEVGGSGPFSGSIIKKDFGSKNVEGFVVGSTREKLNIISTFITWPDYQVARKASNSDEINIYVFDANALNNPYKDNRTLEF